MKIYGNLWILDKDKIAPGTLGFPFRIESIHVDQSSYRDAQVLKLSLRESARRNGYECSYGLIGGDVIDSFIVDMNVDGVEGLVGKEVFGFVHERSPVLQGIAPKDDLS